METFFDAAACEKSDDRILSLRITETADTYTVRLLAPGLSRQEINVSAEGCKVMISNKTDDTANPLTGPHYSFASFTRRLTTLEPVEADNIKTEYKNNFIEVTLYKKRRDLPRRLSDSHPAASSL
jgi:HSP20 family molecular chaperone IbpA